MKDQAARHSRFSTDQTSDRQGMEDARILMKLPAASCGGSQNSISMTPRKQDETEENPVASYGEYSSLGRTRNYRDLG